MALAAAVMAGCQTAGKQEQTPPKTPSEVAASSDSALLPPSISSESKVVYLVDASGSMMKHFPFVLRELRDAIVRLEEHQRFTVIFYADKRLVEASGKGLRRATDFNKQRVIEWMEKQARAFGQSDPLAPLELAFSYEPSVVVWVSDDVVGVGRHALDPKLLYQWVSQLREKTPARMEMVQVVSEQNAEVMKEIAARSGGRYVHASESDLGVVGAE